MEVKEAYEKIMEQMKKRIAGKEDTIELLFITIIANGNALLEGVPGLAKTTMTKALAGTIQADFKRIQGSPDLQPKDIVGYTALDRKTNETEFKKGPIFTNILLVDELNRAPPKTMASFLEALEERVVTVGGVDMPLPKPFNAFATQNPLKIEGTEPIPKVLSDRFIMKIDVDYPSMAEEKTMLRLKEMEIDLGITKILNTEDVLRMQKEATRVVMPDDVLNYITELVGATRKEIHVIMGASPRADIALMNAAKAKAYVEGRKSVSIEDIRFLAKPVLGHRITVKSTGGVGIKGVIDGILASLK